MLGQLVLPSPYVTAFVFIVWAMMLYSKCRFCVEIVEKCSDNGGVYKTLLCAKLKKSGVMWLVVAQSLSNHCRWVSAHD